VSYVFKVVHSKDGVEDVYLVTGSSRRDAETKVLDMLYERRHRARPDLTSEERERDVFGLQSASVFQDYTNSALCRINNCSVNATVFNPDPPYKLYSFNRKTGGVE